MFFAPTTRTCMILMLMVIYGKSGLIGPSTVAQWFINFLFLVLPVTFVRLLNSSSSKSSNIVKSLFEDWPPLIDHDNWKTMSNRPLQWRWFDVTKKPMTLTKSRPSWSTRSQSHDHQRFPAPASSSAIVLQIITPHNLFLALFGDFSN